MKTTEGQVGRVFVIRLEDGDEMPGCVEDFAVEKGITHAYAALVGGLGEGQVVVGPRVSDAEKPEPMLLPVNGAHESAGIGILAPDENGRPVLHMHAALGRAGSTLTGCIRPGVKTWVVGEVVLYEILGANAVRRPDEKTGFVLLQPE
ncbi:MAG: DNA-binding protein [Planctomycetes bacterium]|nr:DNA-binding protein [Planctomycetota bacterium]